jgi:hypothetical protein
MIPVDRYLPHRNWTVSDQAELNGSIDLLWI